MKNEHQLLREEIQKTEELIKEDDDLTLKLKKLTASKREQIKFVNNKYAKPEDLK